MSSVLPSSIFAVFLLSFLLHPQLAHRDSLPEDVIFIGKPKFYELVRRGIAEKWADLPLGERIGKVGIALVGTPYKNYTLELDPYIETPCVNMLGMDCWTFFETALGLARAFHLHPSPTPEDLLKMIELDRYRGGKCTGLYTSRLHHLEDWLYDNQRRGLVEDITPTLPGNQRLYRNIKDMAFYWKSSPQLKANHQLIPIIAQIENTISARGICYLPKKYVPAAEAQLKTGDVICIVSKHPDDYTTHVGLAYRDPKGVLRFLHASKNYRRVTLDVRLSAYLNHFRSHAGIMVARPLEVPQPHHPPEHPSLSIHVDPSSPPRPTAPPSPSLLLTSPQPKPTTQPPPKSRPTTRPSPSLLLTSPQPKPTTQRPPKPRPTAPSSPTPLLISPQPKPTTQPTATPSLSPLMSPSPKPTAMSPTRSSLGIPVSTPTSSPIQSPTTLGIPIPPTTPNSLSIPNPPEVSSPVPPKI